MTRSTAGWWLRLILALTLLSFLLLAAAALVLVFDQMRGGQLEQSAMPWLGGIGVVAGLTRIIIARLSNPLLFLTLSLVLAASAVLLLRLRDSHRPQDVGAAFALLLGLTGFALTFVPEFLYLRDNFGVRMNTVFKFYFQAETLLACACALILVWVWKNSRRARIPFAVGVTILIAAGLVYPLEAINSRTAGFTTQPALDATLNLRKSQPDEWAAIDWLNSKVMPGSAAVLLEAPCPSYCSGGRMSAFTGIPAVLGWVNHEAQWRGSTSETTIRSADISAIYTTATNDETLRLLRHWKVTYVILGDGERSYISEVCQLTPISCSAETSQEKLQRILPTVFTNRTVLIYSVPP